MFRSHNGSGLGIAVAVGIDFETPICHAPSVPRENGRAKTNFTASASYSCRHGRVSVHGRSVCSIQKISSPMGYQARKTADPAEILELTTYSIGPARPMRPAGISLCGHFGAGNLGNEATLQAVIEQICGACPMGNCFIFERTRRM